jgi:hypothetical protein
MVKAFGQLFSKQFLLMKKIENCLAFLHIFLFSIFCFMRLLPFLLLFFFLKKIIIINKNVLIKVRIL